MNKNNLDQLLLWLLSEMGISAQIPADTGEKRQLLRQLMNVRPPGPLPAHVLAWQDQELGEQRAIRGDVDWRGIAPAPLCPRLRLWQGDITRLAADAIVNAANAQMLGCFIPLHNCIDNAIHSAAGMQLREECNRIMLEQGHEEETGKAKITRGYNLPAKFVIHTVGPIVTGSEPGSENRRQLGECYRSSLILADSRGLSSIAFCCISTGVFHYPASLAAGVAVSTVMEYLEHNPQSALDAVIFNVFTENDFAIYKNLLGYGK